MAHPAPSSNVAASTFPGSGADFSFASSHGFSGSHSASSSASSLPFGFVSSEPSRTPSRASSGDFRRSRDCSAMYHGVLPRFLSKSTSEPSYEYASKVFSRSRFPSRFGSESRSFSGSGSKSRSRSRSVPSPFSVVISRPPSIAKHHSQWGDLPVLIKFY